MLSRLLANVKSLLGLGESTGSEAEEDTHGAEADQPSGTAYECSVCGTAVSDPEGSCPLCRSSDVVPADESNQHGNGDLSGGAKTSRSRETPDDAAERLRELREEQTDGDDR